MGITIKKSLLTLRLPEAPYFILKLDVRSARGAGKVCSGVEARTLQMAAGSISSLLFVTGNILMLLKAYRTKDLRSYSLSNYLRYQGTITAAWPGAAGG